MTLNELQELQRALDDVIGYLTDNSCSDPECCGGPYYEEDQFDAGVRVLARYGLKYGDPYEGSVFQEFGEY